MGGLLEVGGAKGMLAHLQNYWGGGGGGSPRWVATPPPAPLSLRLCNIQPKLSQRHDIGSTLVFRALCVRSDAVDSTLIQY